MDSVFPSATLSILVVEDDAELRAAIVRTLTQAGYEAVPASSGEDALDLIAAAEFDRLCCASELPGGAGGCHVCTSFNFIWSDPPVVYASAITAPQPRPENLTASRIKPASSFVYLS